MRILNSGQRRCVRRWVVYLTCLAMLLPPNGLMTSTASAAPTHDGTNDCDNAPAAPGCPPCGCDDGPTGLGDNTQPSYETEAPINFALNSVVERATDIQVPGPAFNWAHTRTYDSRLSRHGAGTDGIDAEGARWHGGALGPYIREALGGSGNIELYLDATSFHPFDENSGIYTAPAGTSLVMTKTGSGPNEEFRVRNTQTGQVWIFYALNSASISDSNEGMLKELTTQHYENAHTTVEEGFEFTYNSSGAGVGLVATVTTPAGWVVEYTYKSGGTNAGKLESVTYYAGSTSATRLQIVEYTYHDGTQHADVGQAGDLIQVTVRRRATHDTGSAPTDLSIVRTTQYRYFTDDRDHQIKMVLESDAIERLLADNSNLSSPDNILAEYDDYSTGSASSSKIKEFASRAFEHYDTSGFDTAANQTTDWGTENLNSQYGGYNYHEWDIGGQSLGFWDGAVKSEVINGDCPSCSGNASGGIKKQYYHLELADWYSYKIGSNNPNQVVRIVVEDTIGTDGNPKYRKLYGVNYRGNAIREAFIADSDPDTTNHDLDLSADSIWCTSLWLNSNWQVEERRMPSAHKGKVFDNATLTQFLNPTSGTNDSATVNDTSGVVYHYTYDSGTGGGNRQTAMLVSEGAGLSQTKHYLTETEYGDGDGGGNGQDHSERQLKVAEHVYHSQFALGAAGSRDAYRDTTTYAYTFWDDSSTGDTSIKSIKTTHPTVSALENGSGTATETYEYFDKLGRLRWTKDGEGYVNYYSYNPNTGGQAFMAVDVPDNYNPPTNANWVAESDGGADTLQPSRVLSFTPLELVTKTEYDDQGRPSKTIDPDGSEHVTQYYSNGVARFPYVIGTTATLPVQASVLNDAGVLEESITVRTSEFYTTASSITTSPGKLVTRTKYSYNSVNGQLEHVDRYFDNDASSGGYHRTTYLYDDQGRRGATIQEVESGRYQVTAQLYDVLGRVIETRRGVATTAPTNYDTLDDPITGTLPTGLVGYATAAKVEYDNDSVGDSHVTRQTQVHTVNASTHAIDEHTVTRLHRTYRGHVRGIERFKDGTTSFGPYTVRDIDWLGRTTASAQYEDGTTITWPTNYATAYVGSATNETKRHNMVKSYFDDQGRVYRTERFPGNEKTNHFEINNHYDRRGNLVATGDKYEAHQEYAYDGAGRQYQNRTVAQTSGTYSSGAYTYKLPAPNPSFSAMSGGNEKVIELSHSEFEANSDNVEATHVVEINHDDTNGFSLSGGTPTGGVRSTVYRWHDSADRMIASGNYGSGDTASGGGQWKATSVPTRPGTALDWNNADVYDGKVLLTRYTYHGDTGRPETVVMGVKKNGSNTTTMITKTFYDDLGRREYVVENWQSGYNPSSGIGNVAGENRTTQFAYNGLGQTTRLTAYNNGSSGAVGQETDYHYLDDYHASLATHTIYPDATSRTPQTTWGTSADQVRIEYNFDRSIAKRKDQRGVVITYTYNDRRQVTREGASNLPGSVDGTVKSIARGYDDLGRVETITSYPHADGSGTAVNQIKHTYSTTNGTLTKTEQEHDGAVGTSPNVNYNYDTSATGDVYDDGLRRWRERSSFTGNIQYYYYNTGPSASIGDRRGQVRYHKLFGGTFLSNKAVTGQYEYNGMNRLVRTFSYVNSGGGTNNFTHLKRYTSSGNYSSFDRFGRIADQTWSWGSNMHSRIDYAYDYAGNRQTRDVLAPLAFDTRDQVYTYDGLQRLIKMNEGTGTSIPDNLATFRQKWTLDQLGNWDEFDQDDNGNGTYDLEQKRYHNDANEIDVNIGSDDISLQPGGNGTNWANAGYDEAGNMSSFPKPRHLDQRYSPIYDAWNRMTVVFGSGLAIRQKNEYDGLHRRIERHEDTDGDGWLDANDDHRHYYYNDRWQCLAETTESGGAETLDALNAYHPQYIDAVSTRIRSNDGYHFLHDANFNVVAAIDFDVLSKPVVERYHYSPYGEVTVLNGTSDTDGTAWTADPDQVSDIDNEFLYTGRRLDPGTGLQINRRRYYHAPLGRWITQDPILYWGGMNLYEYVGGMPSIYVDPQGLAFIHVDPITGEPIIDPGYPIDGPPFRPQPPIEVPGIPPASEWPKHADIIVTPLPFPRRDRAGNPILDPVENFADQDASQAARDGDCDCHIRANGARDMFNQLDNYASGNRCIGSLTINSHGYTGFFCVGSVNNPKCNDRRLGYRNCYYTLTDQFARLNFCKPCTITINACQGPSGTQKPLPGTVRLAERLAFLTGCTIKMYSGSVACDESGISHGDGPFVTYPDGPFETNPVTP